MALYRIFADESRQTKDRFMGFTGLIINENDISNIREAITELRNSTNLHAEIKWTKVSKKRVEDYKKFIELIHRFCFDKIICIKTLIIDNHKVNNNKYNDRDRELGFYKFYFQLFLIFLREEYVNNTTKIILHPDYRSTKYPIKNIVSILNNTAFKRYQKASVVADIEPFKSKDDDIIQIIDLILGAIGYYKNEYHLKQGASKHKIELMNYIQKTLNIEDLGADTVYTKRDFTIWNFPLN